MEAERALRKLVAARNAGAVSRNQKAVARGKRGQDIENVWKETVDAISKGDEERETKVNGHGDEDEMDFNLGFDGTIDERPRTRRRHEISMKNVDANNGMMVNYEKKYWRKASVTASNG